ncbi:Sugar transporter [Coemansia sp. RSA 487]|nr:Sugar transporter [Coemansia sp. RSA 986]KAJ2216800.1 Sugar transporter [Coemansia sp. RSA 487]
MDSVFKCSSVMWLKYGLIKHDHTITFVNGTGTLISFYILFLFWKYSLSRTRVEIKVLVTAVLGVVVVSYVDQSKDPVAIEIFSLLCCLMSLLFLASPLSQIGSVIRLRDASVLLPSVAVLAFFNNVLWAIYGHIHEDPYMVLPNGIGAFFCSLQLALIAFYGRAAATGRLPVATDILPDSPLDDATGASSGVSVSAETVHMTEITHDN